MHRDVLIFNNLLHFCRPTTSLVQVTEKFQLLSNFL